MNRKLNRLKVTLAVRKLTFLPLAMGIVLMSATLYEQYFGNAPWRTTYALVEYLEPQCIYLYLDRQPNGETRLEAPCNLSRRWVVGSQPDLKRVGPNGKVQLLLNYKHDWKEGQRAEVVVPVGDVLGVRELNRIKIRYRVNPPTQIEVASWKNSQQLEYALCWVFGGVFIVLTLLYSQTWENWILKNILSDP